MGASLPDEVIASCAAGFRARTQARRAHALRRADELRLRAQRAARRLAGAFGARKVWLFGSLAWGEAHEGSDVDLLVEGLGADVRDAAMASVEDEIGVAVDLVRVEDAAPGLEERVRREGVLLHGG